VQCSVSVPMAMTSHAAAASSQGLGRYRLLDEGTGLGAVAKGSFGRVYVAIDTQTGNTVAVKRQQLPSRAAARELAFYQVLSQRAHPNVMGLLNHFSGPVGRSSCVYMVFDLMAQDLWNLWKKSAAVAAMATSSPVSQAGGRRCGSFTRS